MVDKNLFLYDLAVVAMLKDEGHYLKEWLDYHLLAGVEHFYLYDHESTDNYNEIIKPYVDAGLVTSIYYPGETAYYAAYNDAVKKFKFHCRYMAFIDGDEFIYPKHTGGGIVEIVDEILSQNPNASGLSMNWQMFGSNGQEKADFSRGVLERFTRRAPKGGVINKITNFNINSYIKNVTVPRRISYIYDPHHILYFEGYHSVNETGAPSLSYNNLPVTADKIVINHYRTKSREEYFIRKGRTQVDSINYNNIEFTFERDNFNDEFDDGILKYRDARAKIYQPPDKSHVDEQLFNALVKNLSPVFLPNTPSEFFAGKMETFLTCRAVSSYLKDKLTNDAAAKIFEEAALVAILKSFDGMSFADARMFLSDLPNLLNLPYPATKEIRAAALQIIPQLMDTLRINSPSNRYFIWKDYVELDYLRDFLKMGG